MTAPSPWDPYVNGGQPAVASTAPEPAPHATRDELLADAERDALVRYLDAQRAYAMAAPADRDRTRIDMDQAKLDYDRVRVQLGRRLDDAQPDPIDDGAPEEVGSDYYVGDRVANPDDPEADSYDDDPDDPDGGRPSWSRADVVVSKELDFGDGYKADRLENTDPLNEPLPIRLSGQVFYLNRPGDSALALAAAELYAAGNLMEQYLAMLRVVQTSLEHTGMQLLRQKAMGPRVPGKSFDDEIVGTLCKTIFDRWGQGEEMPEPAQAMRGNREQRRAAAKRRR